ncbi:MAG: 16S rRNA (guanine(527)-N(7))-methyltransferase RsmG [Blastocatellia bacterium]
MDLDLDDRFRSAFQAAGAGFGLEALTEHQVAQLVKHYSMMCHWNRRINLTRIIEPEEAAQFHYAESLFGARFIGNAASLLDIGSGAGFPAVPLAVARPDVHVVALEANQKKSFFLKEVKDELGLENFKVVTERLESYDWSGFELLTSRAPDRAETILPGVVKHLAGHQRLMLYCGADLLKAIEESLESRFAIEAHPVPQSDLRLIAIFSR